MSERLSELARCRIEEITESDARVYRWSLPDAGKFRYVVSLYLVALLVGFGLAWSEVFKQFLMNEYRGFGTLFRLFWMSASAAVWGCGVYFLYKLLRPGRPEIVRLSEGRFEHDPGRFELIYPFLGDDPVWVTLGDLVLEGRRNPVGIAKSDFGPLRLEQFAGRQQLYFYREADRIEIGEHLQESDREWLAANIRAWIDV